MVDTTERVVLPEQQFALLDLPNFLLLNILQWLDVQSLCYASRTCTLLSKIAAHPSLWPHFIRDGWAVWDVRCTLARILRLPPQVFHVQLDVKRSRRFPVTVPLHNLRPLLNITDTEGLADRLSKAVQDQVHLLSAGLWRFKHWQEYPPAASISVCRADRASVRASLRPEAVVPRLVQHLQQLGWPPTPQETAVLVARHTRSTEPTEPAAAGDRDPHQHTRCPIPASRVTDHWAGPQDKLPEQPGRCVCPTTAVWHEQHDQPRSRSAWPWQADSSSTGTRPHAETPPLMDSLQVCCTRCELLSAGGLHQLRAPRGAQQVHTHSSIDNRQRSTTSITAAAAGRLPDVCVLRETAVNQLQGLGIQEPAARGLPSAAVRLMYASAAADPSMLTFALPGKPGWLIALEKSVKILTRLHTLQRVCLCDQTNSGLPKPVVAGEDQQQNGKYSAGSNAADESRHTTSDLMYLQQPPSQLEHLLAAESAGMQSAWHVTGDRELQLCLAGLQEFAAALSHRTITVAQIYKCAHLLEAAASEYASAGAQLSGSDSVTDAIRRMGLLKLQVEQEEAQVMQKVLQLPALHASVPEPMQPDNCTGQSSYAVHAASGGQQQPTECSRIASDQQPAAGGTDSTTAGDIRPRCSTANSSPTHQMLVRCAMQIESLRALSWCLWLLGVLQ